MCDMFCIMFLYWVTFQILCLLIVLNNGQWTIAHVGYGQNSVEIIVGSDFLEYPCHSEVICMPTVFTIFLVFGMLVPNYVPLFYFALSWYTFIISVSRIFVESQLWKLSYSLLFLPYTPSHFLISHDHTIGWWKLQELNLTSHGIKLQRLCKLLTLHKDTYTCRENMDQGLT